MKYGCMKLGRLKEGTQREGELDDLGLRGNEGGTQQQRGNRETEGPGEGRSRYMTKKC